jgi:hypothetical protein
LLCLCLLPLTVGAQETSDYFTVTPCRLYDSRWGAGPLVGGLDRWVPVGGYCGIPPDATVATVAWSAPQWPDGLKYPWIGDTAWLAPVREQAPGGATSSWDTYLANRKSKGFTAVQIAPAISYWNSTLPQPAGFSFKKKSAGCSSPVPNSASDSRRRGARPGRSFR